MSLAAGRRPLLDGEASISAVAWDSGFADAEAFEKAFREAYLLSPSDYRDLLGRTSFEIDLPSWLRRPGLLTYWGRDPSSLSERVDGRRITWATDSEAGPIRVDAELADHRARVEVHGNASAFAAVHAHALLIRWLGLHLDPRAFEQRVTGGPHAALVAGREGLTLPQTGTVFDAVLWVIAGQQVSLAAAFSIRRRLTERFGKKVAGRVCSPSSAAVAEASEEELHRHGLTRRKAEYLSGIARTAVPRTPDLPADGPPAPSLEVWRSWDEEIADSRLTAVRGLGPWSVSYLLMRSLGFADRVPVGDAALKRALERFFDLDGRPDPERTLELLAPFAPFRSLATFHFWAWSQEQGA